MVNWTANEWLELSNAAFTLLGIAVSALVAYWIVISIQKRISEDQSFKTYLTDSIQTLKNNYHFCLRQLINGKAHAKEVKRDLNAIDLRMREIIKLTSTKYLAVDEKYFDSWKIGVRTDIENMDEYSESFKTGRLAKLSQEHQELVETRIVELDNLTNQFIIDLFKL